MTKYEIMTYIQKRKALLQGAVAEIDTLTTAGQVFTHNHFVKDILREEIVFLIDLVRDLEQLPAPTITPHT